MKQPSHNSSVFLHGERGQKALESPSSFCPHHKKVHLFVFVSCGSVFPMDQLLGSPSVIQTPRVGIPPFLLNGLNYSLNETAVTQFMVNQLVMTTNALVLDTTQFTGPDIDILCAAKLATWGVGPDV